MLSVLEIMKQDDNTRAFCRRVCCRIMMNPHRRNQLMKDFDPRLFGKESESPLVLVLVDYISAAMQSSYIRFNSIHNIYFIFELLCMCILLITFVNHVKTCRLAPHQINKLDKQILKNNNKFTQFHISLTTQ